MLWKIKSLVLMLGFFINGDVVKKLLIIVFMCIIFLVCLSSGSFKILEIVLDVFCI